MPLDRVVQTEISTSRLKLRPLRRKDAALLTLYASDPKVARMTVRIPHPYPPGLAETFIEQAAAPSSGRIVWALDMGGDGADGLMGLVALRRAAEEGVAEISYWVATAFWGTGYASEAVRTIAERAGDWGIHRLTGQVFQDNAASIKVLMRAGFTFTGEGEIYSVARGAMVPTFNYVRESGIR